MRIKLSSCGQRRLWSDWADIQADLSLRWAHTQFVCFVMSWLIMTLNVLFEIIKRLFVHLDIFGPVLLIPQHIGPALFGPDSLDSNISVPYILPGIEMFIFLVIAL